MSMVRYDGVEQESKTLALLHEERVCFGTTGFPSEIVSSEVIRELHEV